MSSNGTIPEVIGGGELVGVHALSPKQELACQDLVSALSTSRVAALMGGRGMGKTRIAKALAARHQGRYLGISDVFSATVGADPARWEEAVAKLVIDAFESHRLVVLDDYLRLPAMSAESMLRGGFFDLVRQWMMRHVNERDLRLVMVGPPPEPWQTSLHFYGNDAAAVDLAEFDCEDYAAIAREVIGAQRAALVDFAVVHRFASMLGGYQLRLALLLADREDDLNADTVIASLQRHVVGSNTRVSEVEALSFDALPGSEAIVEELEIHLAIAFEHRKLAQSIGLKPKRGVLLYGPPGTGKTSIGRALAHRIKGKFFMIDGSFVSEPPSAFFRRVLSVVQDAKANAPSVLFIDDADVLFGIQHISGLSRYLLSLLDGIESETASQVCVMMTAMDATKIPDALLRSGRIELWLETRLPDPGTRARILRRWMSTELPDLDTIDYDCLAHATEGFVAADLRRVVSDATALFAGDLVANSPQRNAIHYLVEASNEMVVARARMAELLRDPKLAVGNFVALDSMAA